MQTVQMQKPRPEDVTPERALELAERMESKRIELARTVCSSHRTAGSSPVPEASAGKPSN